MPRIEWRFSEGSVFGPGHWYADWGDPEREMLLTLSDVIRESDNPVWCIREHVRVLRQIVDAAEAFVAELRSSIAPVDGRTEIDTASPLWVTVTQAHGALHHALALLVDALIECRKGRVEVGLVADPDLAAALAFTQADALNCVYLIEHLLAPVDR